MSNDKAVYVGEVTRLHCSMLLSQIDQLIKQTEVVGNFLDMTQTAITAEIDAAGDADAVRASDSRAARNLLTKVSSSLQHVLLDLRIVRDATYGLDHRAAILLALDLSDTLPWTEDAR